MTIPHRPTDDSNLDDIYNTDDDEAIDQCARRLTRFIWETTSSARENRSRRFESRLDSDAKPVVVVVRFA